MTAKYLVKLIANGENKVLGRYQFKVAFQENND